MSNLVVCSCLTAPFNKISLPDVSFLITIESVHAFINSSFVYQGKWPIKTAFTFSRGIRPGKQFTTTQIRKHAQDPTTSIVTKNVCRKCTWYGKDLAPWYLMTSVYSLAFRFAWGRNVEKLIRSTLLKEENGEGVARYSYHHHGKW